jgi:hypothetical protein
LKKSKINIIKKYIVFILLAVCSLQIQAQVKIGTTASAPNPNAMLEIEATNKGLLLPRLSLVSTTSAAPLTSFVKGMLVYDTATVNDITPGMYYCDGLKWIKVNSGTGTVTTTPSTSGWNLTGNTGTDPNTNFLGTTDNKDVVFKTNSLERVRFTKNGWVGIGTVTPKAALEIKGQLIIDTLEMGDINTDRVLVSDAQGKIKAVSPGIFTPSIQKKLLLASFTGQTNFTTPATITDADKISLYRNGVLISFNVLNSNTIVAEVACVRFDEIRIVQIL